MASRSTKGAKSVVKRATKKVKKAVKRAFKSKRNTSMLKSTKRYPPRKPKYNS